ncbi:Sporulation and spore germination [Clostridium collagenovorans DSM 3089]|uniref:Sporulation and spore germination n=1 Tax=Clostridium collagenovorans DSM 3089 TaxID=1121306 RepID=A0A1M5X8A7_9CLOT|nr:GerMN domain-containing protein [Clostridium collagenovorans]SHH96067.1 Sporulation and spore germination [Clostridium collagenovorans DSM 3089]
MKKLTTILLMVTMVMTLLMLTACNKDDKGSINTKEKIENLKLPMEKEDLVDMNLYFDASKDGSKEELGKEERLANKEEFLGQLIIQELIKGPSVKSELQPILPKDTRLVSFSIKDGIANINFSKEAKVEMTKSKENACLKGISKSLSQLPGIEKVQILIESKNVDTLGGNYDISTPFDSKAIDSRLIKK